MQSLFNSFPNKLKRLVSILVFLSISYGPHSLGAQVNTGELRLKVADTSGLAVQAAVTLSSGGDRFRRTLTTGVQGTLDIKSLPYGIYLLQANAQGFARIAKTIELRSALPLDETLTLRVAPVESVVEVNEAATLVDPATPSSVMRIGEQQIQSRLSSLPGRSIQDLVNSQPGWLYEGNAVLHPRGSEYQTQFVIDGIPLTDNRSPSFGPEIAADEVESMSIYTAGIPAEYGRKMGGIVELNTRRETRPGVHGQLTLGGGSYDTSQAYSELQYTLGKSTLGVTASGSQTDHYLNPVVPQNFTNHGTTSDFSLRFGRDLSPSDTLNLSVRHELSHFQIPNELVQQDAGQLQTGANFETIGTVRYQHILSPNALVSLTGMVRDNADKLDSNDSSTPIIAMQRNDLREGYFKGSFSLHHGRQEFKAGLESDATFLHEDFSYHITDPAQFDVNTPQHLEFVAHRPDLEQSAFVEDQVRPGNWTVSAGVRYDHYQLLLNQHAFSPRISIGRSIPRLNMVVHASYDRVFQTPSSENILISSSPAIDALSPDFLRLPVRPSRGDYYEGGVAEGFSRHLILSANAYRRNTKNFADDDQLLNTGVSYPISFDHTIIYGAEAKLELADLGRFSGLVSYSYMVGNVWFPVTGGLFLGDDADAATTQLSGHFPNSQDQRNTLRTRFRYQVVRHVWVASGVSSGSGLPFAFPGTQQDALAQYGPAVTNRINFDRNRVDPALSISSSLGVDVYHCRDRRITFQVDGDNLNNRLNVIDFGGLFSGNAIGPRRSFALRLNTTF